jgi:hypothetical protein
MKNMQLDSYNYEICLLHKVEHLKHVLLKCPFATKLMVVDWCFSTKSCLEWRGGGGE